MYTHPTVSDLKVLDVEGFNGTLKTQMYRFSTAENTFRYIDVPFVVPEPHFIHH